MENNHLKISLPDGFVVQMAKQVANYQNTVLDNVYKEKKLINDNLITVYKNSDSKQVIVATPQTRKVSAQINSSFEEFTTKGIYLKMEQSLTDFEMSRIEDIKQRNKEMLTLLLQNHLTTAVRNVKVSQAAMGTQALSGKIAYPLSGGSKLDADFGTPEAMDTGISVDKLTLEKIIEILTKMATKLGELNGTLLTNIVFFMPDDIFLKVQSLLATSQGTQIRSSFDVDGFFTLMGSFKIKTLQTSYKTTDGTMLEVWSKKNIVAVDTNGNNAIYYLRIHNLNSDRQAVNYYSYIYNTPDGSEYIMTIESHTITVPDISSLYIAKFS